ncbi:MAG: transcriptional regulator, MarR family [Paenibacillus sp.]|jgi:DNA-binding MarR family transcriptional regulator|uniref:MarR family winged helix-turn-helix transcriptional regulator n=1 Tax=Paenibacillus sp. GCM10012303 TaxID=3317340 RepID=UPI0029F10C34|nr:transcriptional regulator, MarR family [Paenibacillus sp.]
MPPHSNDPLSIDVIHTLVRATHYMQREFNARITAVHIPYPVSAPRLRVLSAVAEAGKIRMNELAAVLGIKARTVTDFVDALENDNLLVRVPDPTDRRATLIQLTELAQAHLEPILAVQSEVADQLLKNLSIAQRSRLYDLLQLLIQNKDADLSCEKDGS